MNKEIAIQAEQITKIFGDFTAVDHISFEVKKGEIFGFLGANGAGKPLQCACFADFLHPLLVKRWLLDLMSTKTLKKSKKTLVT